MKLPRWWVIDSHTMARKQPKKNIKPLSGVVYPKNVGSLTDEVYPNSPLVEVACEVRFPGNLTVECERHKFWRLIRDEYPRMNVPHPDPAKAMALSHFRFESEDGRRTVMLALNSFVVTAKQYPGFAEFRKEFLRLYRLFGRVFDIQDITRAGWRYINVIPFVREHGLVPVSQFLRLGLRLPEMIPEQFDRLSVAFTARSSGGTIATRLETMQRKDGGQEALLLDFDYSKTPLDGEKLKFARVPRYIDEAHMYTRQLFEQMITDDYRDYLRGNVL